MNRDTSSYPSFGVCEGDWSIKVYIQSERCTDAQWRSFVFSSPECTHTWAGPAFEALLETSLVGHALGIIPKIQAYVDNLSSSTRETLVREYAPYHLDIVQGILVGLAAYTTILYLNEHHRLPWYSAFPYTLDQGNVFNRSMFQVVNCPLLALLEVTQGGLGMIVRLAYSFVNLQEDLVYPGPEIGIALYTTVSIQTIIGVSKLLIKDALCAYSERSESSDTVYTQVRRLEESLSQCTAQISHLQSEVSQVMSLASEFSRSESSFSFTAVPESSQITVVTESTQNKDPHSGWRPNRYQVSRY